MDQKAKVTIIALAIAFALFYFMKPDMSITGYSVLNRAESFTVGRSFSSLGPVAILSLILSAGIVALYEVYKR